MALTRVWAASILATNGQAAVRPRVERERRRSLAEVAVPVGACGVPRRGERQAPKGTRLDGVLGLS